MQLKNSKWLCEKVLSFEKKGHSHFKNEKEGYSYNTVNKHHLPFEDDVKRFIEEWLTNFSPIGRQGDDTSHTKLEIGKICFAITCNKKDYIKQIRNPYKAFISLADQSYTMRCIISSDEYEQFFCRFRFPYQLNKKEINIINDSNGWYLIFLPDIIAHFDMIKRQIAILSTCFNPVSFDSLLRIVYSFAATIEEGFLLHSTGLRINGNGHVFFGPSQSGKSTIARFAFNDCEILSDELTLIRKANNGFEAFSTPFMGTSNLKGMNSRSRLKALYLLRKDTSNYIKRIEKIDAIRHLLANILFFSDQPDLLEQMLHISTLLVNTIPIYELHFTLDDSFLRYINDIYQR